MHVDIFESGGIENFPVGDAIESYAACQADRLQAGFFGELSQHAEINLFEAGLQGGGKIFVALLERLVGVTNGAEEAGHFGGEHFAKRGGFVGVGPGHFRAGAMVGEIVKAETETVGAGIFVEAHNIAEGLEAVGLAVSAEAHDFVFIAKFEEAEKLGDGAVEKSERVGEGHGTVNVHAAAFADSPHGAGEIAEAVGGE